MNTSILKHLKVGDYIEILGNDKFRKGTVTFSGFGRDCADEYSYIIRKYHPDEYVVLYGDFFTFPNLDVIIKHTPKRGESVFQKYPEFFV